MADMGEASKLAERRRIAEMNQNSAGWPPEISENTER